MKLLVIILALMLSASVALAVPAKATRKAPSVQVEQTDPISVGQVPQGPDCNPVRDSPGDTGGDTPKRITNLCYPFIDLLWWIRR
jgi:hypothetical protein